MIIIQIRGLQLQAWSLSVCRHGPGCLIIVLHNGGSSTEESHLIPENTINIYPNPMGELMFLEFNEDPGSRIQVGIFNLSGIQLNSFVFQAGGGFETTFWQHQIDNPGAYIVRILVQHPNHWREESHLVIFTGIR